MTTFDRVLEDPPLVHPGSPGGVWRSSTECYRFLANHVDPGSRTLETGCGISTVLLSVAASHTCVALYPDEIRIWQEYMRRVVLDPEPEGVVNFHVGSSAYILPTLEFGEPLDLFFIDGCHGFPFPIIDWFYGAAWLRQGGLLVVDDAHLPGVRALRRFLDRDPRWRWIAGEKTWVAYVRESEGPLAEEWDVQGFLG